MSREQLQEWRDYEKAVAQYHEEVVRYVNEIARGGEAEPSPSPSADNVDPTENPTPPLPPTPPPAP